MNHVFASTAPLIVEYLGFDCLGVPVTSVSKPRMKANDLTETPLDATQEIFDRILLSDWLAPISVISRALGMLPRPKRARD
jgi:hypothetical protein